MSKSIIIALVTVASLVGTAANAREVCKTVSIPTMNCGPNNTKCFVTYTTAQICKQVPDTKTTTTTTKANTGAPGSGKPTGSKVSGLGTRTASRR
jgi:hypothetical protein